MRGVLVGVLVVGVGWYVFQRATAGNAYAKQQGAAQTFGLDSPETFAGLDVDWLGDLMGTEENTKPLRYFSAAEFGEWWPLMSTELLQKLDEFRARLGVPVRISPHSRALGRNDGPLSFSQHNVDMWGEVRAADVMFEGVSLKRAYEVAKAVGFSGIGAYPDWQPSAGLHLDVRPGPLGTWAGIVINGRQVTDRPIYEAFA